MFYSCQIISFCHIYFDNTNSLDLVSMSLLNPVLMVLQSVLVKEKLI